MKVSQYLLATRRETPKDAEIISHQLMYRAGMIKKLASGMYSWLPTGLRVMRKVENIVREEMNKAGSIELLMPGVQPAELWEESGRWGEFGPELLRMQDRHERNFCLGPTHEEVITDIARDEIRSYKQLPANFYQIQTKFRDEVRPRFGVMRAREFIMKDAYTFHMTDDCLQQTYEHMHQAYCNIFDRIGLEYRPVLADTGAIGGSGSHEFHVLAESGEDAIAFSDSSDYAANVEKATCLPLPTEAVEPAALEKVATPNIKTMDQLCEFLSAEASTGVKTLIVHGVSDNEDTTTLVALIIRGDHELNEIKANNHSAVKSPLQFATDDEIRNATGASPGSLGVINLGLKIIADRDAANMSNFTCGANEDDFHHINVNWERDANYDDVCDLRNVVAGDRSPDGEGTLEIKRGIEVGHIFQLGDKYSQSMGATVLNDQGKAIAMQMGCYGIGVTRIVAAAIEQNHDDWGIIWPDSIAPFHIAILPMNMHRSHRVKERAEQLYKDLEAAGYEVYFDDRKERPGVMFADAELIGVPHRLIISDRGIDADEIEYKHRTSRDAENIPYSDLLNFLSDKVG